MTDLRSLTILGLMSRLVCHIDEGQLLAPADVKRAVATGSVLDLLRKRLGDSPEFSPIHAAESVLLETELRQMMDAVGGREEFKLGIKNNGLCLLVAYCLELLVHRNIREITE